ncbi:MAG: aminopeptidase P family protein [Betaproteobacteria bacterium]|nr:MAG: aminopeptidase P family protein [Betaproteobacteria bacterium]
MTDAYGKSPPFQPQDWIEPVNMTKLREGRLARAKKELFDKRKFGAFLSLHEWNTRYITSTYTPPWTSGNSGLRYSMLVRGDEHPIVFEQGDIAYHTQRSSPWLPAANVRYAITGMGWIARCMGDAAHKAAVGRFVDQIMPELKRAGVLNEVLAMDFADPFITAAFEAKGVKCSGEGFVAMLAARKNKLPEEVECLRNTCTIGDAMFDALVKTARPGVSENEVLAEAFKACYKNGGEVHSGVFVTSGPYSWPNLRHSTGRRLAHRDVLYMDVYNTSWNGYKTCYYRTFSVGEPSKATKAAYRRAYDWLYDSINVIKPGISSKDIALKWPAGPDVWGDIGVVHEDQTAGNNWAHGIGLTLYEPPLVWRGCSLDYPMEIEEGMTFAIETQEGDGEGQGVRIEEVIRVTKTGVEILSKWPIKEITVINC